MVESNYELALDLAKTIVCNCKSKEEVKEFIALLAKVLNLRETSQRPSQS